MKKNIIKVLLLISFSITITILTSLIIKFNDDIMKQIIKEKDNYEIKYINAKIDDNTIIPGKKGKNVNIKKSYSNMKKTLKYNPNLFIYDDVQPEISIFDNYDKYIINGNKRAISFVFYGDIEFLNNYNIQYSLLDIVDNKHDTLITKISEGDFCFNKENDNNFYNYCVSNRHFLIKPNMIIEKNFYKQIKENIGPGNFILVNLNDNTKKEFDTVLKYIYTKGYDIISISKMIEE